jgi:predicted DCC family thiol-disulfide oxidoreductase YuxK
MPMKLAISKQPLASPSERPQAAVVVFDGHCNLCTAQIERIARWDTRGALAFLSLHDPEVYARYPELSHDELMQNMVVVDPQGGRHAGADALRQLSRRIPRLWWLVPILHLPGSLPLWQWLYSQVARRRYRFNRQSCDGGTCQLHAPATKPAAVEKRA